MCKRLVLWAFIFGMFGVFGTATTWAQISAYTFNTGTAVSLVDVNNATTHGSGVTVDDQLYANVSIGFAFSFNGASYTSLTIDANGAVYFGTVAAAPSGKVYRFPIANAIGSGCIAMLGADLKGTATGSVFSKTIGTAPNRQFIVQWQNFGFYSDPSNSTFTMEMTLNENGAINFEYGTFSLGSTFTQRTPQVGLRGATTNDVNARTGAWSSPSPTTGSGFAVPLSVSVKPQNISYTFAPPSSNAVAGAPTITQPSSSTTVLGTPVTLGWTAIASASGYTINIGTDQQFTSFFQNSSAITGTSVSLSSSWFSTLTVAGTQYFARVRATVNGQSGPWSPVMSFKVGLPVVIASVAPTTLTIGQTATLTMNGTNTNFVGATAVRINSGSTTITGTITSRTATTMQASFAVPASAPAGTYTLTVDNAPGSITSSVGVFAASTPADPTVSSAFATRSNGWNFCNCDNNVWPSAYWSSINYNAAPYSTYPVEFRTKATRSDLSPSWDDFAASVGRGFTVYVNNIPTQQIINAWQPSDWGGSCYGFTVSSLFNYIGTYNAAVPFSLQPNNQIRTLINRHQAYQGFVNRDFTITPNQTVTTLRQMLGQAPNQYQSIAIFNYVGTQIQGGHSVVPYKITSSRDASNNIIDSLYVYDNNWPGDLTKAIVVNRTANTWLYPNAGLNATAGSNQPWGGNKGFMPDNVGTGEKVVSFTGRPIIQAVGDTPDRTVNVYFKTSSGAQPEVSVNLPQGGSATSTGKDLFGGDQTIEGAFPIIPLSGSSVATLTAPIGLSLPRLPTNALTVNFKPANTNDQNTLAVNSADRFSANMRWKAGSTDQPQVAAADFGNDLFAVRSSGASSAFSMTLAKLGPNAEWENVVRLQNTALAANDSLDVRLLNDGGNVVVTNYGSAKRYDVNFSRGADASDFKGINVGANEAHTFAIQNFGDIGKTGVTLYIDFKNDGKIDSTIVLRADVVTSVKAEPTNAERLALQLNAFPNPSDGRMTFEYVLTGQAVVTLEIVNLLGQSVMTIVNTTQTAGTYTLPVDVSTLPNGMYFYRLYAGSVFDMKPLQIVK